MPLLQSIKLFVHLSPILSSESLRALKISGRFIFLSTMYKSLDLIDEAIISTVSALLFDIVEVSLAPSDLDPHVRLLESLAKLTRGVIRTGSATDSCLSTDQRIGLESSLVLMLWQRNRSEYGKGNNSEVAQLSALNPARAVDLLLDSLSGDSTVSESFEQRCGAAFNLGDILKVMFTTNAIPPHQQPHHSVLLLEKTKVTAEMMVKLAHLLQRKDNITEKDRAATLADYNYVCRLAESYIRQSETEDAKSTQVTASVLFVVASVSLISCHPSLDFDSWSADTCGPKKDQGTMFHFSLSENYANKAATTLDEPSGHAGDWALAASVIRSALDLYRFQLSCMLQQERMTYQFNLKRLQVTVEDLQGAKILKPSLGTLSKHCLVNSLSRLCGLLSLEGEDLWAVQVAKTATIRVRGLKL
jgi:hypothetical protein